MLRAESIVGKLFYNSYIYVTTSNSLKINYLQMKILEIFTEKLRYKNYSPRTIKTTEIYTHVSNQMLSKVNLPI